MLEVSGDILLLFISPGIDCHVSEKFNTNRPRQNDLHFPDDIFKYIFLNENVSVSFKINSTEVCSWGSG